MKAVNLEYLNSCDAASARALLTRACGSEKWVDRMIAARPFADGSALVAAADEAARGLARPDWLQAFAQHPRIGDMASLREKFAATADLAGREQAAVATATIDVLQALAEGNADFEQKFGHIFIVCASGKSAAEMLALLQARLNNPPESELAIAAAEQLKITRLRLQAITGSPGGEAKESI